MSLFPPPYGFSLYPPTHRILLMNLLDFSQICSLLLTSTACVLAQTLATFLMHVSASSLASPPPAYQPHSVAGNTHVQGGQPTLHLRTAIARGVGADLFRYTRPSAAWPHLDLQAYLPLRYVRPLCHPHTVPSTRTARATPLPQPAPPALIHPVRRGSVFCFFLLATSQNSHSTPWARCPPQVPTAPACISLSAHVSPHGDMITASV